MSRRVQIPVKATEKTKDGRQMQMAAISGPLRFPDMCMYCGDPDVAPCKIDIRERVGFFGNKPTWTLQTRAGLCSTHQRQSRIVTWILSATGILAGLLAAFVYGPTALRSGAAFTYSFTGESWMAFIVGAGSFAALTLAGGYLGALATKLILGIFLPQFRHFRIGGGVGIKTKLLGPSVKAGRMAHTLEIKFANDAVAEAFEALNPVNEELVRKAAEEFKDAEEAAQKAEEAEKQQRRVALETSRLDQRVDQLVKTARDPGKMTAIRTQAIAGLSLVAHPRADEQILLALAEDSPDIASAAAMALYRRGFPEAAGPLIDAIRRPGEEYAPLRVLAIKALLKIAPERAAEPLLERLADHENENHQVLREASYGLGELANDLAVDPLKALLQHDRKDVRLAAENALKRIEDAEGLD